MTGEEVLLEYGLKCGLEGHSKRSKVKNRECVTGKMERRRSITTVKFHLTWSGPEV